MLAKLQFKDYHVMNMSYKFNPYNAEEENLSPDFSYNIQKNSEDPKQAIVSLTFHIGDETLEDSSIYVSVTIAGEFEVFDEDDEEQIDMLYKVNAIAILYPYLRSIVSEITSKGTSSPIILPTMNIAAMFNQ
ncbi:protein-export chaperone SecB [Bacillus sp. JJ864]|uniref:protein-export chaperone SecB n=1 Tax=Bacillus sp. JJ864 TaxID=3122975 RepID=UPI0030001BDF